MTDDFPKVAARQFRQIRSAMRRETPDWPAGLGDAELTQLEDGSPSWRFADRVYTTEGHLICELTTDSCRIIDPVKRTIKTLVL